MIGRCRFDQERTEVGTYRGYSAYLCGCGYWHVIGGIDPSWDDDRAAMRAIDRHIEQTQDAQAEAMRYAGSLVGSQSPAEELEIPW